MQKKSFLQNLIFTAAMAFVMVYAMVCYNIAIDKGGMSNEIFLIAFHEIPIMWPIAIILEMFVFEKLAIKLAFRFVNPEKDNPFFITIMISSCTVLIMCPTMSLVATVIFTGVDGQFIANWFDTIRRNFPMALLWQLFAAGPATRWCFRKIFKKQLAAQAAAQH